MAVVTTLEFYDLVAPGVASREAQCAHGCFSSRTHHANFLDGWYECANFFRDPGLQHARRAETEAAFRRFDYGIDHCRMAVAQNHGSPRADVVDETTAILAFEVGAFSAFEKYGFATYAGKCTYR